MKKNTLKRTLKSGLAIALMGVITVSSVACSLFPAEDEKTASTSPTAIEAVANPQEPTVLETIKVAEPSDMLQVEPVASEAEASPIAMTFSTAGVATVNEEEATISKIITATVTPNTAGSVFFDWAVEWNTNNEGASAVVTDYLTVERVEGSFNKATITAHQIFPNSTIKVTATAKGSGVSGSCVVSFVGLPTEIKLTFDTTYTGQCAELYDEDWQTNIYNIGYIFDNTNRGMAPKFNYVLDNPFHYIQEGYEPNFTFSTKIHGGYGLNVTYTDYSGAFLETETRNCELNCTMTNNEYYVSAGFESLYTAISTLFSVDSSSLELADDSRLFSTGGFLNIMCYAEGSYFYLYDFTAFSLSESVSFEISELGHRGDILVEPYYIDNKMPYFELTIATGNASTTLNFRIVEEITDIEINGGSVVL